ncbi:MAG: hypothetical protein K6F85_06600 [Bacteroidales bacterium]|nr:hypothetical protein [Bacteroidales bacterium]
MDEILSKRVIFMSWGVSNIKVTETLVCFNVEGLLYKCNVKIEKSDIQNLVNVYFEDRDVFSCPIENMIEKLDKIIETDAEYTKHLRNWILSRLP